jgi:hypothetical protein
VQEIAGNYAFSGQPTDQYGRALMHTATSKKARPGNAQIRDGVMAAGPSTPLVLFRSREPAELKNSLFHFLLILGFL